MQHPIKTLLATLNDPAGVQRSEQQWDSLQTS
jgi:hypothetical protein